jgi:DNA polymerase-3 subunit gamma/tau
MPVLARAWQMLLKGHDEVRNAPRPLAAADMVLVRLAYAADLPPPGELARQLREGKGADGNGTGVAREPSRSEPSPATAQANASREELAPAESENPAPAEAPALPRLQSFEDVVALAEAKRDLKLKNALLEQVRLVHFKPGNIELNPLPTAAPDLLQDLMRKLKRWTGRVWIVSTSEQEGAEPLGAQRRVREAREIEQLRGHPAVKEVLQYFPDARIAAVRSTAQNAAEHETEDAPEDQLKNDGTN